MHFCASGPNLLLGGHTVSLVAVREEPRVGAHARLLRIAKLFCDFDDVHALPDQQGGEAAPQITGAPILFHVSVPPSDSGRTPV
jgi:hypothetical protein